MATNCSGLKAGTPPVEASARRATAPIGSSASATPPVDAKLRAAPKAKTDAAAVSELNRVRERMRGWITLAFVVPLASVVPLALLGLLFGCTGSA